MGGWGRLFFFAFEFLLVRTVFYVWLLTCLKNSAVSALLLGLGKET